MAYFDELRRWFDRFAPLQSPVSADSGDHEPQPLPIHLLLDRSAEARHVQPIVEAIAKLPPRIGVVLLCGTSGDDVFHFAKRMCFWDLHDWLNPSGRPPEVQIWPHRGRDLKLRMVEPFDRSGLLTGWAFAEFGDHFADDRAVLDHLRREPKFFVALIAEERSSNPPPDLLNHLQRFRSLIMTEDAAPGACAGLLLFIWVQKSNDAAKDTERLMALQGALAPLTAAHIPAFSQVQPPHFDVWWPEMCKAQRRFRSDIEREALRQRLLADLFGDGAVAQQQVPMQRALYVLTAAMAEQPR